VVTHGDFSHAEASALLTALAATVAQEESLRAIVIKGEGAVHHQLREPRASGDVDLLVAPEDVDRLVARMGHLGWEPAPRSELALAVIDHSTTLVHPDWPCTLDVHRRFPGLVAPAGDAMAAMWDEREAILVAGVAVPIPSWRHTALILAANTLRAGLTEPRDVAEIRYLRRAIQAAPPGAAAGIGPAAVTLGCDATLAPFLRSLGGETARHAREARTGEQETEWWERVEAGGSMVAIERRHLQRARPRERVATAWRLVWPPLEELRLEHPDLTFDRWSALAFRLRRIVRGFSDFRRSRNPRAKRDAETLERVIGEQES